MTSVVGSILFAVVAGVPLCHVREVPPGWLLAVTDWISAMEHAVIEVGDNVGATLPARFLQVLLIKIKKLY